MMKNLLLLGLAFTASVGAADAQKANPRDRSLVKSPTIIKEGGEASLNLKSINSKPTPATSTKNHKAMFLYGTQIGHTYYDLPSNGAVANRIVRNSDGSLSVGWNETCSDNTSVNGFPTRGSGYNYYDGTSWLYGQTGTCSTPEKDFGINSKRTGWPEMVVLQNGKEMVFTHNSTAVNVTSRPVKGTGGMTAWSPTTDLSFTTAIGGGAGNAGTWPRAVTNLDATTPTTQNSIHLIYSANHASSTGLVPVPVIDGVANPMVYSRSTDGGATWDRTNVFLPGMRGAVASDPASLSSESFRSIGGDDYAIAARGNTVAIVAGSGGEPWTLWKSTDNGATFTRRVIKTVLPADTIHLAADTAAYVNDNAHAIIIDNSGNVHVFGGMILSSIDVKTRPVSAGGGTYFRAGNSTYTSGDYPNYGLLYWNDTMTAPITSITDLKIVGVEDSQQGTLDWVGDGTGPGKRFPYSGIGIVSMANPAMDAAGNIYVVYSAVVEGASEPSGPTGQPLRDLYIMKRFNYNGKWSPSHNISRELNVGGPGASAAETFQESVFPSVARSVGSDNKVHIVFQADPFPGMHLGSDVDDEEENFIMYHAYDGGSILGVKEDISNFVNTISAFPNPTTDNVTINVDLKKNANVSVRVTNIMGQEVANVAPKQMAAGNTQVKIDMNGLAKGVYLYTVTSDNFTVTNRLIKQ